MNFTGLFVPVVTPFHADESVDLASLHRLVRHVLAEGADGIVALGTTGEPATLTDAERRDVVAVCAEACGDAPLIVGAGSNTTAGTEQALAQLDPRAAAALVVVPYYTRPTEAGVVEHFRRIAASSPVPVLVYDVPDRTSRPLSADTLLELGALPNVVGFKHAPGVVGTATVRFMAETASTVLAGDDLLIPPLLALGARGAIAASANVAPAAFARLIASWRSGALESARTQWRTLAPLAAALFAEPNPTVIKAVLAQQGIIETSTVRLPLLPASREAMGTALRAAA